LANDPKTTAPKIDLSNEKPLFQWKANEFAEYSKNSSWYLLVIVVAIAIAAVFWWLKNWTAIGVVAAAAIALIAQAKTKPKSVSVQLFREGIVVNNKVYPYDSLKSFWIISGDHPVFRLEQTGFLRPHINVPIAEEDPAQIQLFLAKFLPENEKKGEDIADIIQRWTRF